MPVRLREEAQEVLRRGLSRVCRRVALSRGRGRGHRCKTGGRELDDAVAVSASMPSARLSASWRCPSASTRAVASRVTVLVRRRTLQASPRRGLPSNAPATRLGSDPRRRLSETIRRVQHQGVGVPKQNPLGGSRLRAVEEQCMVAPGVMETSAVMDWASRQANESPTAAGL